MWYIEIYPGYSLPCSPGTVQDLVAAQRIEIPGLCTGVITHEPMRAVYEGVSPQPALIVPTAKVFKELGLLVVTRPLELGPIETHVFNLSNGKRTVRKGDIISRVLFL